MNTSDRRAEQTGKQSDFPTRRSTAVGTAVYLALYGALSPADAQETARETARGSTVLEEVLVTASRRPQTIEEVPYNLSVISAEELSRANVTDVASLTRQVSGLSLYDLGARTNASTTLIIRGLNATNANAGRAFRTFEQSPVGTYIGNAPIEGYFQLEDIERIEVLRGPQGTLYGAGALGGTLRVIPNPPDLGEFSGHFTASAGSVAHSSDLAYSTSGVLNVPLGERAAFRASGKYAYEPGYIDVYGILERTGSPLFGAPVLADPTDPVNSSGVFREEKDWNDQETFTGRAAILWQPGQNFSAELAFTYADLGGTGGPVANTNFAGGPYPLDPRVTFPSGGDYQFFASVDQPYSRETTLTSLDLSYDAGFATLSSTSSYYDTEGTTLMEATYGIAGLGFFREYYAGTPINPRFVYVQEFDDSAHTFSQELRLVSAAGPEKAWDYILGLFYQEQKRKGGWHITTPGSHERSVAQGCTAPYFFEATFPNCLTTVGPNDTNFIQEDIQEFEERSIFGEVTWHFTDRGQLTIGGRYFDQDFTDTQSYLLYTFGLLVPGTPVDVSDSGTIWKINPSYEYVDNHRVYATWSQGFRRGGANSFPLEGLAQESPLLRTYKSDQADNYEIGLKGRFDNGLSYSIAGFYIQWDDPQISGNLPSGNIAVFNGEEAESIGVELESSGPLLLEGLRYSVGFAYVEAELTGDFALPGNNGLGTIVPGLIRGTEGEPLPGSPEFSAAGTLIYDQSLFTEYEFSLALNATYRSSIPLFRSQAQASFETEAYSVLNFSATLSREPWSLGAYVTNLADERAVIFPPAPLNPLALGVGGLERPHVTNRPREIGLRLTYAF